MQQLRQREQGLISVLSSHHQYDSKRVVLPLHGIQHDFCPSPAALAAAGPSRVLRSGVTPGCWHPQNHRMAGTSVGHLVKPSCRSRVTYSRHYPTSSFTTNWGLSRSGVTSVTHLHRWWPHNRLFCPATVTSH